MLCNNNIQFNRHILVIINPNIDEQIALNKAVRLAEQLGSTITALIRKKQIIKKSKLGIIHKLRLFTEEGAASEYYIFLLV